MMNKIHTPWSPTIKVALAIIDLALTHIKKVELDPEVKTEGDNFDYWNSYELEDKTFIDYNIYCGDEWCRAKQDGTGENGMWRRDIEYEYTDPSTWSWDVCAYAVNPPTEDNPYHSIDTSREHYLFSYNKKGNREIKYDNK